MTAEPGAPRLDAPGAEGGRRLAGRPRTAVGIALLAGIAALAWTTMDPGRVRTLVMVVLAGFALRLLLFTGASRYDKDKGPR